MSEAKSTRYEPIAISAESTVVAEFMADPNESTTYQSEAELERDFVQLLSDQKYQYFSFTSEAQLIANLRTQLEKLNGIQFSETEWDQFFTERISGTNDGIVEKTMRVQEDYVQLLRRDDGSSKNVILIDKSNIHNNRLQVINQYQIGQGEGGATRTNRYDVTVLVNGLPMVHIELKRRGVDIREAFNQIDRYQRDSFWAGSGLFEYVQLFVISNGTLTKYYSNTTRRQHLSEAAGSRRVRKTSHSFESHAAKHSDEILCAHSGPDAPGDAAVSNRSDGTDASEDRHVDELQATRLDRCRRICLAYNRVGKNAHELQGGTNCEQVVGYRQGAVRR